MKKFITERDKDYDQLDPEGDLYGSAEHTEYDEILQICREY